MTQSRDILGAPLLRAWLSALSPPSELLKVFPGFVPLPGMGGATDSGNDGLGEGAHLQQFAEVLRVFAETYGAKRNQRIDMSNTILALLSNLQVHLKILGVMTRENWVPPIAWLEAQTHPILGPGREAHRRWAALARAGIAHARALQTLRVSHLEILDEALTRCGSQLGRDEEPALTSVRGVYDFWVRCADATYRQFAFTEVYATRFAAVVDSGSALRQAWLRWQAGNFEGFNFAPGETAPRAVARQEVITTAAPITKKPRLRPEPDAVDVPPRKSPQTRAPTRAASLEFDIARIARHGERPGKGKRPRKRPSKRLAKVDI